MPGVEINNTICIDAVFFFPIVLGQRLKVGQWPHLVPKEHLGLRQPITRLLKRRTLGPRVLGPCPNLLRRHVHGLVELGVDRGASMSSHLAPIYAKSSVGLPP